MRTRQIFIVEDEGIVVEDLSNLLERLDFEVVGKAASGEEALKKAPPVNPDLVLMDIHLEGNLDGVETAVKLRREYGLPIIFLTAYGDANTLERAKAAEPFGYILKPFDETTLRPTLEMALEKIRLERRLEHLHNIVTVVRQVNQLIAREKEAEVLVDKVARVMVGVRGYHAAWITLLNKTGEPVSLTAAVRKNDTLFVNKITHPSLLPPCGREALNTSSVVTFENRERCEDCPLPERYQEGAWVCRLMYEGVTYGILGVALPVKYLQDGEELSLFEELRQDLGAALHALALEVEHQQTLQALRDSEARYRNVIEHIGIGISLISPEMKILSLNRQMREWFPDIDPAKTPVCYEAFNNPPRSAPCSYCPVVKTLADGQVHEAVTETPAGGSVRHYRIIATPVKDPQGRITGVIEMVDDITQREEAARRLKESEERYRLLVRTIPLVVYSGHADGSVEFFYDKIVALTGYPKEIFNSGEVKWTDLIHPEDRQGAKDIFRRALKGDKFYVREYRIRRKDETYIWVRERGQILCDPEGKIKSIIGVLSDITQERRIREKVQEQAEFLQTLIDTIPSPIFYKDANGLYLGCNRAFEAFSGLPRQEIVGKSVHEIWPPEQAARFAEMDKRLFQEPGVQIYESRLRYADGSTHEVIFNKATFHKGDGSLGGLVGVVLDITERKRMEEELRLAKREMEQLINSLSSLLIGLSAEGAIMEWNPATAMILGIEAREVMGRKFSDLHLPWDQDQVQQGITRCSLTGESQRLDDLPFTRPDGKPGFLGLTISPIRTDEGEVGGIIILGADITERRLLENQLAQAQKLEAIGQLAAGIAHEINTPIQFVSDNTRFLEEAFGDLLNFLEKIGAVMEILAAAGESQGVIEDVKGAATAADLEYLREEIPAAIAQSLEGLERVAKIVRAMKDFSHPGSEDKVAVDLNKALESTITVSRNEWKYVADLVTDFDPTLPLVYCFPQELNQVFLNIIVNAAQAIKEMVGPSPEEKKTITVSTRRNGDWVEVRIADTGPGIPENIRHRIFDPFFTTKEVGKGTGQGLAISHAVIRERHQGTITFESEVGVGTTFIIRLPLETPVRNGDGTGKIEDSVRG